MKNKIILILLSMFLISGVWAVPQTFNIHGKLTDSSGSSLSGTYNMTFRIYDNYTAGNNLWTSANQSVLTDSNGIYNVILAEIDLSFSEQYYLGVEVGTDGEMSPRINLTSSPYSFRANVSDYLEATRNYEMANLTLSKKITFALGEIIDNIADGWVKVTGGLNVTEDLVVKGDLTVNNSVFFVNSTSGNVGIGTTTPTSKLHIKAEIPRISFEGAVVSRLNYIGSEGADNLEFAADENNEGAGSYQAFRVDGDEIARITRSGGLGIGTTTASSGLELHYSSSITSLGSIGEGIVIRNTDTTSGNFATLILDSQNISKRVQVFGSDGGIGFGINFVEKARIDSSGNLGIGTTSPSQKLDVRGQGNFSGTIFINNNTDISNLDTNASTICSGTTTYLDGEGNCDDISGVYIDETDQGNLNVNSSNYWDGYNTPGEITSGDSQLLDSYDSGYFMPLNTSVTGDFDFNGGWSSGGLSIINGDLFAQTGWFYNISSLSVSSLNINGSLLPYQGFDNQFDLGSSSLKWKNLYIGTNAYINGTVDAADFTEAGSATLSNSISGNSATATALAANPGNCEAGNYPLGVDASGAVESCTDAYDAADDAISDCTEVNACTITSDDVVCTDCVDGTDLADTITLDVSMNIIGTTSTDFSINNSDFFVDFSTGNVGIGNASSGAKFYVQGDTANEAEVLARFTDSEGVVMASIEKDLIGHGFLDVMSTGGGVKIHLDSSDDSYFNPVDGNFGIGTATPNSKLHVVGGVNITGNLSIGGRIQGEHKQELEVESIGDVEAGKGMVLYMKFNNDSSVGESYNNSNGTVIYDYSDMKNNGTTVTNATNGGPQFTTSGMFNGAFEFDGDDDYVEVDKHVVTGTCIMAVAVWLKAGDMNDIVLKGIAVDADLSSASTNNWALFWDNRGGSGKTKALRFLVSNGSTQGEISVDNSLDDTNWHHIVGSYNGSHIELFKDGFSIGVLPLSISGNINEDSSNGQETRIGFSNSLIDSYFNGLIDQVTIYNRSLSADEILEHYEKGFANIVEGSVLFDDGIAFALGEIIDNIVNGWIRIVGGLEVTGDIKVGKQTLTGLCPTGWIMVPGDASLGTIDFCVMKYEAKARDGVAQSIAAGTPWVSITQTSAIEECKEVGAHLCTMQEVLTISRDIASVASNWNDGIGSCLYGGHMDNYPTNALAASTDNDPYSGTNDVSTNGFLCPFATTASVGDAAKGKEQRRTYTLSNGEIIWDWSGNVMEWMVNTCTAGTGTGAWDEDAAWEEWSSSEFDDYERATIGPSNSLWNSNNGTGQYYGCTVDGNAVIRGGRWFGGADAGPFSANLNAAPSASYTDLGFRCCSS